MKIMEEMIPVIEKALNVTLYDDQKQYLLDDRNGWFGDKSNGKIFAYCIKLALSEGESICIDQPHEFCDLEYSHKKNKSQYSPWFINFFRGIWNKLNDAGLVVRAFENKGVSS